MSKTLVIAEKPSVARDLAAALPGTFDNQDSYLESEDTVITFAVGGISWPAHVGGLAIGLALGFGIGLADRRMRRAKPTTAAWLVVGGVALVVAALFFIIAVLSQRTGGSESLERMGGIALRAPVLAALFLIGDDNPQLR